MSLIISKLDENGILTQHNIDLSPVVFDCPYNEDLVHQLIVKTMANARIGSKSQKTRSEVRGGGIKPWRQKGTGRARSGSRRSPIWRAGGVTFAAKERDYKQKLNRKMFKAGIKSVYSELIREQRIVLTDSMVLETAKTKELSGKLKQYGMDGIKILILVESLNDNLLLASRNLVNVVVSEARNINPVLLVSADKILATVSAIKEVERGLI